MGIRQDHRWPNQSGTDHSDRVSKRNGSNTNASQFLYCLVHFFLIPRVAIGISKRHRNVSDDAEPRAVSSGFNRFQHLVGVFECLVLIFAQKRFRDGRRITQSANCVRCYGALGTFLIHHNPDDFDVVRQIDLLQHLLAVGHLWDRFGRDKTYSIDVLEPRPDQRAQITHLQFRRDLPRETLPSVARAFDQFDSIVDHGNCNVYLKNSFARSKKLLRIGVFSSPQSAANSSSLRRCSGLRRDGTSTISLGNKSPWVRPFTFVMPLPRSLNICPLCVPAGTLTRALPSSVGTSISPPKAATENGIGTSQYKSSASRWKMLCSLMWTTT